MKKYCFSKCFKRKMTKNVEILISFLITIIVAALIISGFYIVFHLLGLFYQLFLTNPEKINLSTAEFGMMITIALLFMGGTFYVIGYSIIMFVKKIVTFIKDRYEGKSMNIQCKIFEECSDN